MTLKKLPATASPWVIQALMMQENNLAVHATPDSVDLTVHKLNVPQEQTLWVVLEETVGV